MMMSPISAYQTASLTNNDSLVCFLIFSWPCQASKLTHHVSRQTLLLISPFIRDYSEWLFYFQHALNDERECLLISPSLSWCNRGWWMLTVICFGFAANPKRGMVDYIVYSVHVSVTGSAEASQMSPNTPSAIFPFSTEMPVTWHLCPPCPPVAQFSLFGYLNTKEFEGKGSSRFELPFDYTSEGFWHSLRQNPGELLGLIYAGRGQEQFCTSATYPHGRKGQKG